MSHGLLNQLQEGAMALHVSLAPEAGERMMAYLALLGKWNRVYNLTAIRDEEKGISHHLLDSLAILPHLPPGRMLDVGSGAGLPGIPVAIAQPERPVTLLDSNQKKGAFLKQAVAELGLANVDVAIERVEHHRPAHAYEVVTCRAFSSLADFVALAGDAATDRGVLVAMKGQLPEDEIRDLPPGWQLQQALSLTVPSIDAARHLVLLRRAAQPQVQ